MNTNEQKRGTVNPQRTHLIRSHTYARSGTDTLQRMANFKWMASVNRRDSVCYRFGRNGYAHFFHFTSMHHLKFTEISTKLNRTEKKLNITLLFNGILTHSRHFRVFMRFLCVSFCFAECRRPYALKLYIESRRTHRPETVIVNFFLFFLCRNTNTHCMEPNHVVRRMLLYLLFEMIYDVCMVQIWCVKSFLSAYFMHTIGLQEKNTHMPKESKKKAQM